jgi:hypothetical protein
MMMKRTFPIFLTVSVLTILMTLACSQPAAPTPTPLIMPTGTQTNTPEPTATTTNTPKPTHTPKPTATPNVAATQNAETFQETLERFQGKGYISTTDGESTYPKDFEGEYAKLGYYYKWWWPLGDKEYSRFVFSAHFKWASSGSTSDASGCGLGFGIKSNENHYAIFLDRENLFLMRGKGTQVYDMGTSGGKRFASIPIPAKADFVLAVWDQNVTVSVNDTVVTYILSSELNGEGKVAFSVLSGTNGGYGTRCEMSNIIFWTPK